MDFEQGNAVAWDLYHGVVNGAVAEITNTVPRIMDYYVMVSQISKFDFLLFFVGGLLIW